MYEDIVKSVNDSVPPAIEHLSSSAGIAFSNMSLEDKITSAILGILGVAVIFGLKKAIQLVQ